MITSLYLIHEYVSDDVHSDRGSDDGGESDTPVPMNMSDNSGNEEQSNTFFNNCILKVHVITNNFYVHDK